MGMLFVFFMGMMILALVGTVLLFAIKTKVANDVLLILMTVFALIITYFSFTALPTNYIFSHVVACVVGLIAVVGVAIRFFVKKQILISKFLVCASVFIGIFYLYFA